MLGFGYDTLVYVSELGCSVAEMDDATRQAHRRRARRHATERPGAAIVKSRTGWTLATLYLVVSAICLYATFDCRDGFFCGLRAIPVLIPAGVVYLLVFAKYVASPAIMQWQVLVPAVATNVLVYYLLGRLLGRLWQSRR